MTMQRASVGALQTFIERLREDVPLGIDVRPQTRFVADLGLSSLELIGLVFMCEQAFGVNLVDQPGLLSNLHTVGQAVAAIDQLQCDAPGCESVAMSANAR